MSVAVELLSMSGPTRFDEFLEAIADGYRRELLLALMEHNPQDDDEPDPLDIHPSGSDPGDRFDIFMNHLPKLSQLGIIEWQKDADEVVKGPNWEEFSPLLELIADNTEKLPEEWFATPEDEASLDEPSES